MHPVYTQHEQGAATGSCMLHPNIVSVNCIRCSLSTSHPDGPAFSLAESFGLQAWVAALVCSVASHGGQQGASFAARLPGLCIWMWKKRCCYVPGPQYVLLIGVLSMAGVQEACQARRPTPAYVSLVETGY